MAVLAVNAWGEDKATLQKFAREQNLRQRILLDGEEVAEQYRASNSVPVVFWINSEGMIVDSETGASGSRSLRAKTERLVAEPRP